MSIPYDPGTYMFKKTIKLHGSRLQAVYCTKAYRLSHLYGRYTCCCCYAMMVIFGAGYMADCQRSAERPFRMRRHWSRWPPIRRCTLDRNTGVKLLPGGQLGFALASSSVGSCCCYYCVGRLLNVLTNTRHRQFPVVIVSSHEIVVTASHPKVLGRTCSPALHS